MKKIGVLVLSIVIGSALFVGCGGKKEVAKDTDNKKATQTQNQTTDNKNSSNNSGSNGGSTNGTTANGSTSNNGGSTASVGSNVETLVKEEKEVMDKAINGGVVTEQDQKKYPGIAVNVYAHSKYDNAYYVNEVNFSSKISDTQLVYEVVLNNKSNEVPAPRKMTVTNKNGIWTVTNDEEIKLVEKK